MTDSGDRKELRQRAEQAVAEGVQGDRFSATLVLELLNALDEAERVQNWLAREYADLHDSLLSGPGHYPQNDPAYWLEKARVGTP